MASNPSTGFDFNRPTIVALLYLAGFLTGGVTTLIGVVLAYVWKNEPHDPWEATHYTYLIRTFWIAVVAGFISSILILVLIGFLLLFAISIWMLVRAVISLTKSQKREPMPDPATFAI